MSDIPIRLDSDFQNSVSSAAEIGITHDSRYPSITHDYMDHKVVSLIVDSDSQRVFGNSLDERAHSLDSFEALMLDGDVVEDHTKVPMPLLFRPMLKYKLLRG